MYLKAYTLGPVSVKGVWSKLIKPRNFLSRLFLPSIKSTNMVWVPGKGHETVGNWTQHFLISLHLSHMLGPSISLRFTSLLVAASCCPGPFPSLTDHCGTSFSISLHYNFCHLPGEFYGPPTQPTRPFRFLDLVLSPMIFPSFSHCKVTPWIVLHHELAPL